MLQNFWKEHNLGSQVRHIDIITGIISIGFVITVRWFGGFQFLELSVFDRFMRSRPQEMVMGLSMRMLLFDVHWRWLGVIHKFQQ